MAIKKVMKNPVFEKRVLRLWETLAPGEAFLTLHGPDIYYLSGCTGSNNHLLLLPQNCIIFTDGRYLSQIQEQSQVNYTLEEISPQRSFGQALKDVLKEHGIKHLRFSPDGMSYLQGKSLIEALPEGSKAVQDSLITQQRMIKDEIEIEIIRQNTLITKAAYLYIQGVIKPGMSELEAAAELEYFCRKQGAVGMSFSTIIASGARSALPHGIASEKIIEDNELIQFDFGIVKNRYCSDFSRVLALGSPPAQLMQARQIVEDALKNVFAKARCGMTGIEIDGLAREVFQKHEVEHYFVHGLGHSLGIEIHENPRLNTTWDKPITENMVITIEPGVYFPGLGGVRLEDTAVMRSDGFENITLCSYDA